MSGLTIIATGTWKTALVLTLEYQTDRCRWAMGIFWAVVVAIGLASRLLSSVSHGGAFARRRRSSKVWRWIRRSFLVPATFGYRSAQNFGWATIPPRIQTLTILAFAVMNVAFSIRGYRFFKGNFLYVAASGIQDCHTDTATVTLLPRRRSFGTSPIERGLSRLPIFPSFGSSGCAITLLYG